MMVMVMVAMRSNHDLALSVIAVMVMMVVSALRDPYSRRPISFIGRFQFSRGVGYGI
jgi:hypothetical protein